MQDTVINDLILIIILLASFEIELDSLSEEELKEIKIKILKYPKDLYFITLNDLYVDKFNSINGIFQ